eukprot:1144409-Pelagomonas_calceolata.AAC.20
MVATTKYGSTHRKTCSKNTLVHQVVTQVSKEACTSAANMLQRQPSCTSCLDCVVNAGQRKIETWTRTAVNANRQPWCMSCQACPANAGR